MKPVITSLVSAGAALFFTGCVQTAYLRVENHSRRPVSIAGPVTSNEAAHYGISLSGLLHVVPPGKSMDVAYHVRKTTGLLLPLIGGITTSETEYSGGFIVHNGRWSFELPKEGEWRAEGKWTRRGVYYRGAHRHVGTLLIGDRAADNVLVTPEGLRLLVKRTDMD